jgi:signal transduction histidine kinase
MSLQPSAGRSFPRLVSLACHDLRTPLATVYGFARTLSRTAGLDERSSRFVTMIEEASAQMTQLLDDLGLAARIEAERWEPLPRAVDTLELASSDDERIAVEGAGETIETEAEAVQRALSAFAIAAVRYGPADKVTWSVSGRTLVLAPVESAAAPVLLGDEQRDLGSLVARLVLEALGGSVVAGDRTLVVRL